SSKGGSKNGEEGVKKGLGWVINMATVDDIKEYQYDPDLNRRRYVIFNAYDRILFGDPALRMRTGKTYSEIDKNVYKPANANILKNIEIRVTNPIYDDINLFINSDDECNININIYDVSGRLIKDLSNYSISKGDNKITIDSSDMKTGIYLINVKSDNFSKMLKAVVIK
ncbi:MAG: T9SS type A sorting domain-containing protein, partial [bacterium]